MKVDTTQIQGYADMSAEEKVTALEGYEIAEPEHDDKELNNLRTLLSKRNSEIADIKKQLKDKMSEAERAEVERAEKEAQREARIAELERNEKLAQFKAKYIALGYDETTASANAEAYLNGDTDTLFANQKAFIEATQKSAVANAMNRTTISQGNPPNKEDAQKAQINVLRRAAGLPEI